MNVVDFSGWLEYFADAPNADFEGLQGVRYRAKEPRV